MLVKRKFVVILILFAILALSGQIFAAGRSVNYKLEGMLVREPGKGFFLHVYDGRVFQIAPSSLSIEKGKKFEKKFVVVEGQAESSLNTDRLKLTKIDFGNARDESVFKNIGYASYQKPAKLISKASENKYVIDNIRWDIVPLESEPLKYSGVTHDWKTATVDVDKLQDVYLVIYPMEPEFVMAHALLAFNFEKDGLVSKDGRDGGALALTIEAALPPGQMYNLPKTLSKTFNVVWNLTTLGNYARQQVLYNSKEKSRLVFYKLKLDDNQKRKLLQNTVEQACKNRKGEFYHLTRNNCTQNLILLINTVLEEKIPQWWVPNCLYNLKATLPLSVVKDLHKRGIITDQVFELEKKNIGKLYSNPAGLNF